MKRDSPPITTSLGFNVKVRASKSREKNGDGPAVASGHCARILIVDNDRNETARSVVEEFAARKSISIDYQVEPKQNIALARNRAVEHSIGEYLVYPVDSQTGETHLRHCITPDGFYRGKRIIDKRAADEEAK